MKVKIWGVRGSIPTPGETTLRYGGNTSCVQVEIPQEKGTPTFIVLDAGTGIRNLGDEVVQHCRNGQQLDFYLFITHFHWDHIQGFPFFSPLYRDSTRIRVFGPVGTDGEELIRRQMSPNYFPISLDDDTVKAKFEFHTLPKEPVEIGDYRVHHHYVNHGPLGTAAGYKVSGPEGSFVYIPDIEPFDYKAGIGKAKDEANRKSEMALIDFVRGADAMLFDTMFTADDYSQFVGWGHSPAEYALDVAAAAGVSRLGLFHYAPLREDSDIDHLTAVLQEAGDQRGVEVFASKEGLVLEIPGENGGNG